MKKKLLLIVFGIMGVIGTSVFTTMAFLTDVDKTSNTYTVGNVDIVLDESNVDELGMLIDNDRVQENEYHLMPGYTYVKDPMITVLNNSDDSYVRILITVNNIDGLKDIYGEDFTLEDIYDGWSEDWVYNSKDESLENVITYEYRYKKIVNGVDGDNKLEPIFKNFSIPGETTSLQLEEIQDLKIDVVGQAIQAVGFENADAAWNAFSE